MRYALKVDANQQAVISALEAAGGRGAIYPDRCGEKNSNYKNAGWHVCQKCSSHFHSYVKTRKFCSHLCYAKSKPRAPKKQLRLIGGITKKKKETHPKVIRSTIESCEQCGSLFKKYPSQTKVFCSYKCHLDSGGAIRAGNAAVEAKMKYGAKKDANHDDVVRALEDAGVSVLDMSSAGGGFPDLLCGINLQFFLVEIKNTKTAYGRRGLNKRQIEFHAKYAGFPIFMVDGVESALRMLKVLKNG